MMNTRALPVAGERSPTRPSASTILPYFSVFLVADFLSFCWWASGGPLVGFWWAARGHGPPGTWPCRGTISRASVSVPTFSART